MAQQKSAEYWEHACGPLCQHPSCWGTAGRCRQPAGVYDLYDSDSGSDTELPTLKVYDMLSDYGPVPPITRPRDRTRASSSDFANGRVKQRMYERMPSGVDAPFTTPASTHVSATTTRKSHAGQSAPPGGRRRTSLHRVIVHEFVDVEEMRKRSAGHKDKVGVKMVWVPKRKRKQRKVTKPTIQQMVSRDAAPPINVVPVNDVTQTLLPPDVDVDRGVEAKRRQHRNDQSPRRFYAKDNRPAESIDLFSLPPELLHAVIERLQESDDIDQQRIVEALMRVVPTFSDQEYAYKSLLKQEKAKLYEAQLKTPRQPVATYPSYRLDENVAVSKVLSVTELEKTPEPVPERTVVPVEQKLDEDIELQKAPSLSNYPIEASLKATPAKPSTLNPREPLPPIKATSLTSIALGLPEIPSGLKFTKTFTYKRRQFHDFSLGPVSPVPTEDMRSSPRTIGESSVHMACPTESSVLGESADQHRLREVEVSLPVREQVRRQKTPRREVVTHSKTTRYKMDPMPSKIDPMPCPPPGSPVSFGLEPIQESIIETGASSPNNIPESTVAISEQNTPRSRTRGSFSRPNTAGGMTTDSWPDIREEDYLNTPTPPEGPSNTMVNDETENESKLEIQGISIEYERHSEGVSPAGGANIMAPAPPPPSPNTRRTDESPSPDFKGSQYSESSEKHLYTLEEEDHYVESTPPKSNGLGHIPEEDSEEDEEEEEEGPEEGPESAEKEREITQIEEPPNRPSSIDELATNTVSDIMASMGFFTDDGNGNNNSSWTGVWFS